MDPSLFSWPHRPEQVSWQLAEMDRRIRLDLAWLKLCVHVGSVHTPAFHAQLYSARPPTNNTKHFRIECSMYERNSIKIIAQIDRQRFYETNSIIVWDGRMGNYADDLRFLRSTPRKLYVPTLFFAGKELGRRTNVKLKEGDEGGDISS